MPAKMRSFTQYTSALEVMSDSVDLAALDALHAAGQFDQVFGSPIYIYICI